jgi:hypothetical protein
VTYQQWSRFGSLRVDNETGAIALLATWDIQYKWSAGGTERMNNVIWVQQFWRRKMKLGYS